jgi:hypothetical protein
MLLPFRILGIVAALRGGGHYKVDVGYAHHGLYGHGHGHGHNNEGCGPYHNCIEPGVIEHYIDAN